MNDNGTLRLRQSLLTLQNEYDKGNKAPLEALVRAWKGIQELPPSDKRSFFVLGGYHGEPFNYRTAVDALSPTDTYTYWGGWCNHGNVLFPTWHRVYLLKLEDALRSIVPGVTLPFWDETDADALASGMPWILTREKFELDGVWISNPLRSFTLPLPLNDNLPGDNQAYVKPSGYETVRYPLSGLVGTPAARAATAAHNAKYPDPAENVKLLNENVTAWLNGGNPTPEHPEPKGTGINAMFRNCLEAPNYTVFSNTTSAGQWNLDHPGMVVPLEQPHNDIHLAVGGFDFPGQFESGQVADANGDMGENNTAALDPIFYFHHCNVDRVFWLWQQRHDATDVLTVITGYAGTSSSDSQGPTPGIPPGTPLDVNTPLNPFVKDEFGNVYTSMDCINIERQLGYGYGPGSFDAAPAQDAAAADEPVGKKLTVRGIDRALFEGSFVIRAYAAVKDATGSRREFFLGSHSVLSRRNVVTCANCLTHLEVVAHFSLNAVPAELLDGAEFFIAIQHRGSSKRMNITRDTGIAEVSISAQAAQARTALPDKLRFTMAVSD